MPIGVLSSYCCINSGTIVGKVLIMRFILNNEGWAINMFDSSTFPI